MNKELAKRLASKMTIRSFGIDEVYSTSFNNLEMEAGDGTVVQYQPPCNMRLQMSNIPAVRRDGEPVLMSKDEIVLCRLGLDRNGLTRASRASMQEEDRAALEFYERTDVLEYQARLEIAYGKCDIVAPEEALTRRELSYIGPDLEKLITDGLMDVLFVDEHNADHAGLRGGRPQRTSVDLYWLRRIIRKQRPGDKLDFGMYFMKLSGDVSQTLAGDSRFITHVIFGKFPTKNARTKPLDRKVGRLGLQGRGYLVVLRMQDIRHGIETYMSQLVPFPDGRGTMHDIWLLDHPTPEAMDDPGLDKFLAQILAAGSPATEVVEATGETPDEAIPAEEDVSADQESAEASEADAAAPEEPAEPATEPEAAPADSDELPAAVRELLPN